MSTHQLTTKERELLDRARHDAMNRAWLKPRIKRRNGAWVCEGRGTTATGLSPQGAYSVWTLGQQMQVIYATQAQSSGKVFEGLQC